MRLGSIVEGRVSLWYKGVSVFGGLGHYLRGVGDRGVLPLGFLGDLGLAFVYADPSLTGDVGDPSIIVEAEVGVVEDRTREFFELGYDDVSMSFPEEWRDEGPWTVRGGVSAHGDSDFVFIGVPWPYRVVASFENFGEWSRAYGEWRG